MNNTLWNKNFTTLIIATFFGAVGNIAGGFALSFLVFEETSSTFAAALTVALRLIPGFFIPLLFSPMMDRLPRKPFLVACDAVGAVLYLLAGIWLKNHSFNYIYYLLFSLGIASLGSIDQLSYNAIYPKVLPPGMEEKGYSVSSMLYPTLMAIMMPLSAFLYKKIGVGNILIIQGALCLLASVTESRIKIKEEIRPGTNFSLRQWWGDIREALRYFKEEKGISAMTLYSATSYGFFTGYETVLVAFFSTMPGFSIAMYSFFTVVEMVGRTIGGVLLYKRTIPNERKYRFARNVYFSYESMDACLLWLPYPLMLINRTVCGFLGAQSGTLRVAATQKYIPDSMRARVNALQSITFLVFSAVLSLTVGALGELLDYRVVMTICGLCCIAVCFLTIVRNKDAVSKVYTTELEIKEETVPAPAQ